MSSQPITTTATTADITTPVDPLPFFVGIVGAAGAGKDSLGQALSVHGALVQHLADPIKGVCMSYYSMSGADAYDQERKGLPHPYMRFPDGTPMTMRNVMEQVGDCMQGLDKWVLVRHLMKRTTGRPRVVVCDVRTDWQVAFIKRAGGLIVHVTNRLAEEVAESAEGGDAHHTKTTYRRARPDIVVANEGTLEDLKREADRLVPSLVELTRTRAASRRVDDPYQD